MERREGVVVNRRRVTKEWVDEYCIQDWGQDTTLTDALGVLDGLRLFRSETENGINLRNILF